MFCTKCGSEIPAGDAFCTNCGAKQEMEADSSNLEKAAGRGTKKLAAASRVKLFFNRGNKKPLGKGKIVIGAAAVVIAAGALIFLNVPKNKVMLGAYKTGKAILKEDTALDKILGLSDIKDDIVNGKTMQTVSAEVKGSDSTWGIAPDIGLKGEIASDRKKGTLLITGYPTYNGKEQLEGILYRNEAQTVMAVPDLYDGYFYFDNATMKDKFYDSALNRLLLEQGIEILHETERAGESRSYSQYTGEAWKQLYKGAKVTRDENKSFQINGKTKRCKGYEVVFSKKDMKNLLKSHIKFIDNHPTVRALVGAGMTMDGGLYGRSEREKEARIDDEMNYIIRALETCQDSLNDDLTMLVYIGPKGRVVSVEGEYDFEFEDDDFSIEGALSLLGKGNPLDDVAIEGSCSNSYDNDRLSFEFTGNQTLKKSDRQVNSIMELSASDGYGKGKCTWEGNVDAKDKTWDLTVKLPSVTAKAEGTLDNLKKGKSLQMDIDKLKMEASGITFLTLEGSYSVAPLGNTKIENPSDGNETIDLFDMGESDIRRVVSSAVQNLEDIGSLLDL